MGLPCKPHQFALRVINLAWCRAERFSHLDPPLPTWLVGGAGEAGYIGWHEIQDLIAQGAKVVTSTAARSSYLSLGTFWASFDTPASMFSKIQGAAALNLGGLMVGGCWLRLVGAGRASDRW